MTEHTIIILTILKTITVLLGAVFLFVTARAYVKHRTQSLLVFLVAILLITIGVMAEGIAFQLLSRGGPPAALGNALDTAHVIEAVFMLAGYVVLVASLLIQRTHRIRRRVDDQDARGEDRQGPKPPA
jgi:hypothetical protein